MLQTHFQKNSKKVMHIETNDLVKQKILDTLKKEKDVSIDDLMIHFTISEIAVRKHLKQLEADGFVQKANP